MLIMKKLWFIWFLPLLFPVMLSEVGATGVVTSTPTPPRPFLEMQVLDLPSQGVVNDVVVRGRYAYLASGSAGLQIVDTESPELSLVGQVDTAGYALSLDVIGDYAYLADELHGLRVIDISTPTRPQEIGFYDPVQPAEHVVVAGAYAYVLTGTTLRIVDVSIPTQPVEVGLFQTIGLPAQVVISEQHAYVINERQAIDIIDISDPTHPQLNARYPFAQTVNDIAVVPPHLYLLTWNKLHVIDIATPQTPTEIKVYDASWLYNLVFTDETTAYASIRDGLVELDLSQPTAMTVTARYHVSPEIPNIQRDGDTIYGYHKRRAERLWLRRNFTTARENLPLVTPTPTPFATRTPAPVMPDFPTPPPLPPRQEAVPAHAHNVELIGHLGGAVEATALDDTYLYVGFGPELAVMDVAQPTSPQRLGYVVLPEIVAHIYIADQYAYVLDARDNLWVIDVSDPLTPVQVGSLWQVGDYGTNYVYETIEMSLEEDYLYLASRNDRFGRYRWQRIVDVSDPTQPTQVDVPWQGGDSDTDVWPTLAGYAYQPTRRMAGFHILDGADPASAERVATYPSWSAADNLLLSTDQEVVYLATETRNIARIDVSTPNAPTLQATWPQSTSFQLGWADQRQVIYRAAGPDGLQRVDIHTAQPPTYTTLITTPTADVTLQDSYLYAAHGQAGLSIYDVTQPATPSIVSRYATDDWWVAQVTVAGEHVYLSGYDTEAITDVVTSRYELRVLNIAQPEHPVEVARYEASHWIWDIVVAGSYAYLLDNRSVLRVLDVSDPTQPVEVGQTYLPNHGYKIALDDPVSPRYAAIAGSVDGLRIIDVSNPAAPTEMGFYETVGEVWDITIADGLIYLLDRAGGLYILRVSDSPAPMSSPTPAPTIQSEPPKVSPLSPYELVDLRNDDPRKIAYLIAWGALSPDSVRHFRDAYFVNLVSLARDDTDTSPDAMVKMQPGGHGTVHYLFYQATPDNRWIAWEPMWHIELAATYGAAEERLVTHRDESWLVIKRAAGSGGSDPIFADEDLWYWLGSSQPPVPAYEGIRAMRPPQPEPGLIVPVTGESVIQFNVYNKVLTATTSPPMQVLDQIVIDVHLEAEYSTFYNPVEISDDWEITALFDITGQVRYVWQPDLRRFTYVPAQSTLSQHQFTSISRIVYGGDRDFLIRDNLTTLLALWASDDLARQCWLASYLAASLSMCPEHPYFAASVSVPRPEKQLLLTVMAFQ